MLRITLKDDRIFESDKAEFIVSTPPHVNMAGVPYPASGNNCQGDFPDHLIRYDRDTFQFAATKIEKIEKDGFEIYPFNHEHKNS